MSTSSADPLAEAAVEAETSRVAETDGPAGSAGGATAASGSTVRLLVCNMLPATTLRWDLRSLLSGSIYTDTLKQSLPPGFRFIRAVPLWSEGSVMVECKRDMQMMQQPGAFERVSAEATRAVAARVEELTQLAQSNNRSGNAQLGGAGGLDSLKASRRVQPLGGRAAGASGLGLGSRKEAQQGQQQQQQQQQQQAQQSMSGGDGTASTPMGPQLPTTSSEAAAFAEFQIRKQTNRWTVLERLLGKISVHPVFGTPFIHDMPPLFLSSSLNVEAHNADTGELITSSSKMPDAEDLYPVLRMYGNIRSLDRTAANPITGAATVQVQYRYMRYAVAARHCLENARVTVGGGKSKLPARDIRLRIRYLPRKVGGIRGFYQSNPRIAIPLTTALVAFGAYMVFDPLRAWSIKIKLTDGWSLRAITPRNLLATARRWGVFETLREQQEGGRDRAGSGAGADDSGSMATWAQQLSQSRLASYLGRVTGVGARARGHRGSGVMETAVKDLEGYLQRIPTVPLVVLGPRGTGKASIVHEAHQEVEAQARAVGDSTFPMVFVDMEKLLEDGKTGEQFVEEFASAVGFFPSFAITTVISGLTSAIAKAAGGGDLGALDSAADSVTGRVSRILAVATTALETIQAEQTRQGRHWASVEQSEGERAGNAKHPPAMPLIVFHGFSEDNYMRSGESLRLLMFWAWQMQSRRLGRIIFTFEDEGLAEYIRAEIPEAEFDTVIVQEASKDDAIRYVASGVAHNPRPDEEIGEAVEMIGGRLNDLNILIARIDEGRSATDAAVEIVRSAASDIRELLLHPTGRFHGSTEKSRAKAQWDAAGLWDLITLMAESPDCSISYDQAVFRCFMGDDNAVRALVRTNAFSVDRRDRVRGPQIIAGSRATAEAFKALVADPRFKAAMDMALAKSMKDYYFKKVVKVENELTSLAKAAFYDRKSVDPGIEERRDYLIHRLAKYNKKLEHEWDKEYSAARKIAEA